MEVERLLAFFSCSHVHRIRRPGGGDHVVSRSIAGDLAIRLTFREDVRSRSNSGESGLQVHGSGDHAVRLTGGKHVPSRSRAGDLVVHLTGDEEEKEAEDPIAFLKKTRDPVTFLACLCVGSGCQIRV